MPGAPSDRFTTADDAECLLGLCVESLSSVDPPALLDVDGVVDDGELNGGCVVFAVLDEGLD